MIGAEIVDGLFGSDAVVGQAIRVAGRRFTVIGVQGRIGTAGSGSIDKYVWIPLRAFERALGAPRSLQVFATAGDGWSPVAAEDHARTSLRAARSIGPGRADNFDVLAPEAARGFVANLSHAHWRSRGADRVDGPARGDRRGHQHRARVGDAAYARDRRCAARWARHDSQC